MNTTLKKSLEAVRNRVATPEQWLQNTYAKDADGNYLCPMNRDDLSKGVCFCLLGALHAERVVDTFGMAELCFALGVEDVVKFNDAANRTHADILSVLDAAIARA